MLNINITSYTTYLSNGVSFIHLILPYTQYTCLMLEALHSLPFPARINSDEAGSFLKKDLFQSHDKVMYGAIITDTDQAPKNQTVSETLYLNAITKTILHLTAKPPQTRNKAALSLRLYYIIKSSW